VLKDTVADAVVQAREALEDLLVEVPVTSRTPNDHVPGQVQTYVPTVKTMKMAVLNYTDKEIDGNQVKSVDLKAVLFPIDGSVETNDLILHGGVTYRIHRNDPTMIGTTVLINTLQLRPT
jgi:hypothetical protein